MIRLSDILERLNQIQTRTLRTPTHLLISEKMIGDLVSQYNELANSDADSVYQYGEKAYSVEDVESFFGVQIVISRHKKDEFKILEEVTPDS